MKKFTFKTEKSTGQYRSFFQDHHYVKLNKIQVGMIGDEAPYRIRLQVIKSDITEDGNLNCEWKWITLKKNSESVADAKTWLNENITTILEKYNLVTK
jgi:hypothetical protein